jgi:multimeric flavodoxin WrbA
MWQKTDCLSLPFVHAVFTAMEGAHSGIYKYRSLKLLYDPDMPERIHPHTARAVTKVLGVSGSPRKGGNSDILLEAILRGAGDVVPETETVHLRDYQYQSCTGCERCRADRICTGLRDGMTMLYPSVISSRGLVLVSPTHTYNVSALMKAFIDRLYCLYDFGDTRPRPWSSRLAGQGRKAVIAAICEQPDNTNMGVTLEAMRLPLVSHGYEIVDEIAVYGIFDRGAVRKRPDIIGNAVDCGRALGTSLIAGAGRDQ